MGDQHPSWRLICMLPLSVAALACGGAPAEPTDGGRDSSVVDASEEDAFVAIDAGPPGRPVPPAIIVELNLGETWSAALLDDGDVWVWGGLGFLWPTVVPAFSDVTDIGFAGEPPCAIYDGGAHCLVSSVSESTAIDLPRLSPIADFDGGWITLFEDVGHGNRGSLRQEEGRRAAA